VSALHLYGKLIGISLRAQMQYRASFWMLSLGQFIVTGVEFIGVWALFARFGQLVPWTLAQVAFFYGAVNVAFAFTDAAARGFDMFGAELIKTGNFDRRHCRLWEKLYAKGATTPATRVGRRSTIVTNTAGERCAQKSRRPGFSSWPSSAMYPPPGTSPNW